MHFFFFLLISSQLLVVEGRAAERRVQFVDVAEEVGVVAQNVSGDSEQTYLVDSMMGGSAFFDYDQDGDLDLYILNGSKVVGFPDQEHPRNTFYRNERVNSSMLPTKQTWATQAGVWAAPSAITTTMAIWIFI